MIKDIPIREYRHRHCFLDSADLGPVRKARVLAALFSYATVACENLGASALHHACVRDCFFDGGEDAEFDCDGDVERDVEGVDWVPVRLERKLCFTSSKMNRTPSPLDGR